MENKQAVHAVKIYRHEEDQLKCINRKMLKESHL